MSKIKQQCSRSNGKTAIAVLVSSFVASLAIAQTDGLLYQYTSTKPFIQPINLTENLREHLNLESGSITLRFKPSGSGFGSLLGFADSATDTTYASFYYMTKSGKPYIGLEMRVGQNSHLINNNELLIELPSSSEFNTVTYNFDRANNKIDIYLNGEKNKSIRDEKFLADYSKLSSVYLGKTDRVSASPWRFIGEYYYADISANALTEAEIIEKHRAISEKHLMTLSQDSIKREAFGATKTDPEFIYSAGYSGASNYRIPSLLTTKNGVVIAAIDRRNQGGVDWGDIDTAIRRSLDGGKTWQEDQILIDLVSQPYGSVNSAFLIDPLMVQDKKSGRIFMLVDMFPESQGFFGIKNTNAEGSGHKFINGKHYQILTDSEQNQYTVREGGVVYNEDNKPTEYRVVVEGNPDVHFKDLGDLYLGNERLGNVFLQSRRENNDSAPLKTIVTTNLWLTYSDDDGATWSSPKNITPQVKADWMRFMGTGPGTGIQLKNGNLIMPVYYTNTSDKQAAAVIISTDGGETWTRSESPLDRSLASSGGSRWLTNSNEELTESQLVELDNGDIKLFSRNHKGSVQISTSKDGGYTWQKERVLDSVLVEPYSQLSVIKYSKRINGKEYLIFSNPHYSNRTNGQLWLGEVQDDGSINWKYTTVITTGGYAYSSLTELPDGDIGLLYEKNNAADIGYVRLNLQEFVWRDNILHRDARNTAFEYSQDHTEEETLYKIGDGEIIKVGLGINAAKIVVDEGILSLNQQANAEGNRQAFAEITVNEKGILRLLDDGQIPFNHIHLNQGTLDLYGQSLNLTDDNAVNKSNITGSVVNSNVGVASTLAYSVNGHHSITGKQLGDGSGKLDFVYQPNQMDSSLVLHTNSQLENLDIQKGLPVYGNNTQHTASNAAIDTDAALLMQSNVTANLKNVHLNGLLAVEPAEGTDTVLTANTNGQGHLVKTGEGTLYLSGELNHSGTTVVNQGDVVLNGVINQSTVTLEPSSILRGNGQINSELKFGKGSWLAPDFDATRPSEQNQMKINHLTGNGGSIYLTVNNDSDTPSNWKHNQLLVKGNVVSDEAIPVSVNFLGDEVGNSDSNNNQQYDANEGISLLQVKGNASLDAFKLSAYERSEDINQVALVSVDKGASEASENGFGEGNSDFYDYRLQTKLIDESGNSPSTKIYSASLAPTEEVHPKENSTPKENTVKTEVPVVTKPAESTVKTEVPVVTKPTENSVTTEEPAEGKSTTVAKVSSQPMRAAINPLLPSYIVAHTALMADNQAIHETFINQQSPFKGQKQRLYVIQQNSQNNYRSNLGFVNYGYGFKSRRNSTLLGGYIPVTDNTELYGALSYNQTRIEPKAVDGYSKGSYKSYGAFVGADHQWGNLGLDLNAGYHFHKGTLTATSQGDAVLKGHSWQVNSKLRYDIPIGNFIMTPFVGLGYEQLSLREHQSANVNWKANFEDYKIFKQQVGADIAYKQGIFQLKTGLSYHFNRENGGDVNVRSASQQEAYRSGKLGNYLQAKVQAQFDLTPQFNVGVAVSYQKALSGYGIKQTNVQAKLEYQF